MGAKAPIKNGHFHIVPWLLILINLLLILLISGLQERKESLMQNLFLILSYFRVSILRLSRRKKIRIDLAMKEIFLDLISGICVYLLLMRVMSSARRFWQEFLIQNLANACRLALCGQHAVPHE